MLSASARLTRVLTVGLGLAALSTRAIGQAPPPKPPVAIPAVEVVATRVPEAPHDVPASIEVISGSDLRARGVTSLKDALSLAAGIAIAPGGDAGPASAIPEFWGLREFDAFLLVVDGIPWGGAFNPAVSSLSLRDVERIEILRGPAPVTYGATSFVGVIHVVHKAAAETARYLAASGGSFGSGSASIDLTVPWTGSWKTRASADFDKQGFKDDRTSFTRGHALLRSANVEGERKTWLTSDFSLLQQDPASPHVREGPALSTATHAAHVLTPHLIGHDHENARTPR
jgi:outer membrane receptor protein involved in Fe transport